MCGEFSEIFQLCHSILQSATKTTLLKTTLETLLRFLNWIPLGYIFETDIIDQLVSKVCSRFTSFPDHCFKLRTVPRDARIAQCLAQMPGRDWRSANRARIQRGEPTSIRWPSAVSDVS